MSGLPPGPRGLDAYGFFGRGSAARAVEFLQDTTRRYGPVSSFQVLGQRVCLVDDADLVQQILVTDQHLYVRDNGARLLRELIGEGLLTLDEPQHRERRRIVQPAFHRAHIAEYGAAMAAETERAISRWADGQEISLAAEMKRLTLSIVGAALFGIEFGENTERIAQLLGRAIKRSAFVAVLMPVLEPWLVRYRRRWPAARSLFFARERAALERILQPLLAARQRRPERDIMSLLLDRGELSPDEVKTEVLTLVLAGHETTANALTWAWYLLSQNPDAERALHTDVGAVLGDRPATIDDLPNLRYAGWVFQEALRLYPPVLAFGQRPLQDVELRGYTVPKGTSVILSPYITHRNPRYFDNPGAFVPERWETLQPARLAYFPFGAGAKMCIGDGFARMEGTLVLAAMARRYRLRFTGSAVDVKPGITLAPAGPVPMRLEKR